MKMNSNITQTWWLFSAAYRRLALGSGAGRIANWISWVKNLTLQNRSFTLASHWSAGIGSGYAWRGNRSVANLLIEDGWLDASAIRAAGIGTGFDSDAGFSSIRQLTILKGFFITRGDIGSSLGSGAHRLTP
jgi:hypothetical protein